MADFITTVAEFYGLNLATTMTILSFLFAVAIALVITHYTPKENKRISVFIFFSLLLIFSFLGSVNIIFVIVPLLIILAYFYLGGKDK